MLPQTRCNIHISPALFETDSGIRTVARIGCLLNRELEEPLEFLQPHHTVTLNARFMPEQGYAYAFSPKTAEGKKIVDD